MSESARIGQYSQTPFLDRINRLRILSELQRVCDRVSSRVGVRFNIESGEACKDGTALYTVRCFPTYPEVDERAQFLRRCVEYGMEEWMLDTVFDYGKFQYRVAGLRTNSVTRPVVCERVSDKKMVRMSVYVARLLRKQRHETKTL